MYIIFSKTSGKTNWTGYAVKGFLKYYLKDERSSVLSHIKTRREAKCFMCDETRLTSSLNGFKNVSVRSRPHWQKILKIGSVWTEKFKVKVYANEEKSLSHVKTLIKNVFFWNFRHELFDDLWKKIYPHNMSHMQWWEVLIFMIQSSSKRIISICHRSGSYLWYD